MTPAPKTEPLLGLNLDAFDLVPNWMWWVLAGGIFTAVAFAVRAAF